MDFAGFPLAAWVLAFVAIVPGVGITLWHRRVVTRQLGRRPAANHPDPPSRNRSSIEAD